MRAGVVVFAAGLLASAPVYLAIGTAGAVPKPPPDPAPTPTVLDRAGKLPERGLFVGRGAAAPPDVKAAAWLVADADSGEILAASNPHVRLRPASTMKMLTVLAAVQNLSVDQTYVATERDRAENGSRVGLSPGQTYTVGQLISSIFLVSGNDAAHALAEANGGVEATMAQMREIALRIGASRTTVRNVTGLEERDPQFSTAHDLALIGAEGLRDRTFRQYAGAKKARIPNAKGAKPATLEIATHNRLYWKKYPGAIGIKDGYTSKAGRTFVGAATRNGRTLIVALLRVAGHTYPATKALLDWGFANPRARPIGHLGDGPLLSMPPSAEPSPLSLPASEGPVVNRAGGDMRVPSPSALLGGLVLLGAGFATIRSKAVVRSTWPGGFRP